MLWGCNSVKQLLQWIPYGTPADLCFIGPEYSASRFCKDARAATELVLARNRVPIVVGGTCNYLRWYAPTTVPFTLLACLRLV